MKNKDTWNEANRFSANLSLIGSIACLFFVMLCVIFIQSRVMQLWALAVLVLNYLFGVIFITEWHLRKVFDESGRRKTAKK